MRPITLSLSAALVVDLRDHARQHRIPQAEVLLDALSAAQDRLDDLLARNTGSATVPSGGLFVRSAPKASAEPMSTLTLRLLAPNVDAIDELVDRHDAPSRSSLCAAALRDYLSAESATR